MAIDWVGFAYAALLAVGGVVGYTRKGTYWDSGVWKRSILVSSLLRFVKKIQCKT